MTITSCRNHTSKCNILDWDPISVFCSLPVDDDQEGVLDGLMEALNTGSAFRDPSRPARKKAPGGKKCKVLRVTQSISCHVNRNFVRHINRLKELLTMCESLCTS